MWREVSVNMADLLISVSEGMDLADPSLCDHQLRTAYGAWQLGQAAKLPYPELERLVVAALLHDLGALSPEEKSEVHRFECSLPEVHCARGEALLNEAAFLAPSAAIVGWHHTPWSAHRARGRAIEEPDVLASQILFLADSMERAIRRERFILHQKQELLRYAYELSGDWVHPDVVSLFQTVAANDHFWLTLTSHGLASQLRHHGPLRTGEVDFGTARSVAGVFKDMVDFRSRYTASHSAGVAACASELALRMSFTGKDLQLIELAGLLHDLGKLVVPNEILAKPGRLNAEEHALLRQHPHYSHRILSQVRGLEQVAEWAGFHHERLDGSGYCVRLTRAQLDLGSKIVAVADVATAVGERRPYRGAGDPQEMLEVVRTMADYDLLDRHVVAALGDDFARILAATQRAQLPVEERYLERYQGFAS